MAELRHTTLHDEHVALGGRMVPFAGYEMPIQYAGIIAEHVAVRTAAGLFDVSHMGQVFMGGDGVEELLHRCFTNNHPKGKELELKYTFVLNERGRIKDDMIVTKLEQGRYLTVPNAATTEMILAWLREHAPASATIDDQSDDHFCLALQGPKAAAILSKVTDAPIGDLGFFRALHADLGLSAPVLLSRSGYTGEDGFELIGPAKDAPIVWRKLLEVGKDDGLLPCGLGARDTLRMEKGFLLSGQDYDEDRTPLETNTEFAVKYDHDFLGRGALEEQKAQGGYARFCGLQLLERKGVPRNGYAVLHEGEQVGALTSGTQSPTLGVGIGLTYLEAPLDIPGTALHVDIRGRAVPAEVAKLPLVAPPGTGD